MTIRDACFLAVLLAGGCVDARDYRDQLDAGPDAGPDAGVTARSLISEWSGCLKAADFVALDIGGTWATKSSAAGSCLSCHSDGAGGLSVTADDLAMYERLSTNELYLSRFFVPDLTEAGAPHMVSNADNFRRVGAGEPPHQSHPPFSTAVDDPAMVALDQLYDVTMDHKTSGTCGPPRILP